MTNKDEELCKSIISIAKAAKCETIAEGVETLDQLKFLLDGGCDIIQGDFFCPPLPINDLVLFIKNYKSPI